MSDPADDVLAGIAADRHSLEADLRRALADGELSLTYQPIVDAKSRSLAGIEPLARWECPGRGWVPPDEFIPLAEELGLIEQITDFVLRRAGRDLAPLLARHPDLKLSINLPPREVSPGRVAQLLGLLAAERRIAPDRMQFEITERTLLGDCTDVHTALDTLVASGATVALDDFGTGYSSLSYLDRFPINCLKIDKSFVQRLAGSARVQKLTEAILLMAGALDVQTVAEGVETIDQLAFLIGKGCRFIQGYLFSRPLSIGPLEAFVAAFRFPDELLDAALWPKDLGLPRLLADNQEQVLRLFVEHVPAAVAMFDSSMRYIAASGRWIAEFCPTERDIIGRRHYDVIPHVPDHWREINARCLAGAAERCEAERVVQPDGTVKWLRWDVLPFTNSIGDVVGIIIFTENITNRKLAEATLQQKVVQLELAGELAGVGYWHWDAGTRTSTWSDMVFRIIGRDRASVRFDGDSRFDVFHPDDRQAQADMVHHAIGARAPFHRRARVLRPDGTIRDVLTIGQPQLAEDGTLLGYLGVVHDITEQIAAANDLARSGAENLVFRGIIEALPDLVFAKDRDGRFIVANPATLAAFGMSRPEQLIGKSDHDLRDQESADHYRREEQALMRDGRTERFDHCLVVDGETRFFSAIKAPLRDAAGHVIGLVSSNRDVTDARRARELSELRARENDLYRLAFEGLPDNVFVKDLDGRFLLANGATAMAMGAWAGTDLIGLHDRDFYPADKAEQFAAEEQEVLTTGRARIAEQPFPDAQGNLRWKLSSKRVVHDATGSVFGLVGVEHDITELVRARAEAARERQQADLYRQGIEILPDLFYVKDTEHRFIAVNHALALQLGAATADDVIGRTDADFHPPALARRYRDQEAAMMANGEITPVEERVRRVDGTMGWFSTLKAPLRDANGTVIGIVGHARDITEQKRVEAALQRQSDELRDLSKAVWEAKTEAERGRDMLTEAASVVSDGFALFDRDDRLILCNEAYSRPVGASPAELAGVSYAEVQRRVTLLHDQQCEDAADPLPLERRRAKYKPGDGTALEVKQQGRWFLIQERHTKDGSTVVSRADITHLKNAQDDLRQLANHDALTGISNRRDFINQGSGRFGGRDGGGPAALVMFDIDHFKRINDTYGHPAGDAVLRQLAQTCLGLLRPTDLLARWGGEEFIVLLPTNDAATVVQIVERLRRDIAAMTVRTGDVSIRFTASFGVALGDGHANTLDELIERADAALYRAKRAGRNRIELTPRQPSDAAVVSH